MPTTKSQKFFYMFFTVLFSVMAFITYNISRHTGLFTSDFVTSAIKEFPFEFVCALTLQALLANKLAVKTSSLICKIKPNHITLKIVCMTLTSIFLMCPLMTFIVTIYLDGITHNFLSLWFEKIYYNFPFALFIQFIVIGPFMRRFFQLVLKNQNIILSHN